MCNYKELHTITISENVDIINDSIKHDLYDSFLDYSSDNSIKSEVSECKFTLYAVLDEDQLEMRNEQGFLTSFKKLFCIY